LSASGESHVTCSAGKTGTAGTVTVVLPIKDQAAVPVQLDVRGFADTVGAARAVLVVRAGGKSTVVDLPPGGQNAAAAKPTCQAQQARDRAEEEAKRFPESETPELDGDFFQRITTKSAPGATFQVTLFLLVERDSLSDEESSLLTIDSLDVSLGAVEKSAGERVLR
jgi:hypothetical protein